MFELRTLRVNVLKRISCFYVSENLNKIVKITKTYVLRFMVNLGCENYAYHHTLGDNSQLKASLFPWIFPEWIIFTVFI